jgi:hypothetical protein
MLAIMLSEIPFERLVSHAASPAVSLLFPNETDYFIFNGLLSISIGQLMIRRRYYGVMRRGLMVIVI